MHSCKKQQKNEAKQLIYFTTKFRKNYKLYKYKTIILIDKFYLWDDYMVNKYKHVTYE